jgi:hypothetical protein
MQLAGAEESQGLSVRKVWSWLGFARWKIVSPETLPFKKLIDADL